MEAFIARQPIFDQNENVFAYELLFRSGLESMFSHPDPNEASSKVITDSVLVLGMEMLTGGKRAFINATRDILVKEAMRLLPREWATVEILETVEPDPEVIVACEHLKRAGYLLVLDDFVYEKRYKPLVDLADIIKVDVLTTSKGERRAMVQQFAPLGIRLLAEKVETREAFEEALEMGYTYFQGYFFSKPVTLSARDVPGFKLHYLRILQEIHRPELDFGKIEEVIKLEVSFSYKLLRYINSAFFGLRREINSIRQALVFLGEREIKKWVSLVVLTSMGEDKPQELIVQTVIRAKFFELLASGVGLADRTDELFLMGIFSLIDAIVDRPLSDILKEISIADDVKVALLGGENRLREIYEYVLAYEKGDWEKLSEQATQLGLDETEMPRLYLKAVQGSHQSFYGGSFTE